MRLVCFGNPDTFQGLGDVWQNWVRFVATSKKLVNANTEWVNPEGIILLRLQGLALDAAFKKGDMSLFCIELEEGEGVPLDEELSRRVVAKEYDDELAIEHHLPMASYVDVWMRDLQKRQAELLRSVQELETVLRRI